LGKGEIKLINEIKDLSSNLKNGLLFTENLSNIFLLKAEVVGIKGIVTNVKMRRYQLIYRYYIWVRKSGKIYSSLKVKPKIFC
jgi:hypothetical protein